MIFTKTLTRLIYIFCVVGLSICWYYVCDGMLARMSLVWPSGESPTYNKYSGMRSLARLTLALPYRENLHAGIFSLRWLMIRSLVWWSRCWTRNILTSSSSHLGNGETPSWYNNRYPHYISRERKIKLNGTTVLGWLTSPLCGFYLIVWIFLLSLRLHLHLLCQLCIFFVSYSKSSVNHSLGVWQPFFSIYNSQFADAKMGKMHHSIWTNSVTDRTVEEHL